LRVTATLRLPGSQVNRAPRIGGLTRAAATALAAAALFLTLTAGAIAEEDGPLRRYRPTLVFDRDERNLPAAVDGRRHRGAKGPRRVYGHLVRHRGRRWLQYWLFYAYNPQDRGVLRTGRHEGDWELLQLRLDRGGVPDLATLAQHHWAEGCTWQDLRKEHGRPVVFVANASHAMYSQPGVHDRPFPDPNDEADGRGPRLRPPVEEIEDRSPAWVAWPGSWGASEASWIPGEASSPRGPASRSTKRGRDRPISTRSGRSAAEAVRRPLSGRRHSFSGPSC
jgi:hypothetical protein